MLCLAPIASKAGQQLSLKAPLFGFVLAFSSLFFHFAAFSFLSLCSQEKQEERARKQPHRPVFIPPESHREH